MLSSDGELDILVATLVGGGRYCPSCATPCAAEKEDPITGVARPGEWDCDHMRCIVCNFEFCRNCGHDMNPIFAHGNNRHQAQCPHYGALPDGEADAHRPVYTADMNKVKSGKAKAGDPWCQGCFDTRALCVYSPAVNPLWAAKDAAAGRGVVDLKIHVSTLLGDASLGVCECVAHTRPGHSMEAEQEAFAAVLRGRGGGGGEGGGEGGGDGGVARPQFASGNLGGGGEGGKGGQKEEERKGGDSKEEGDPPGVSLLQKGKKLWKESSGRKGGAEGYQFGDMSRSVFRGAARAIFGGARKQKDS